MTEIPREELGSPVSVRLPKSLLDELDEMVWKLRRRRSEVLIEAVHTWLRLQNMDVDPTQVVFAKGETRDEQLDEALTDTRRALEHLVAARMKLIEVLEITDT